MAERIEQRRAGEPFFSICIPQYNRTSFLIEACRSFAAQSFRDFEVCISDDCSTDGRARELLDYLRSSGLPFVWEQRERNLRYDGNLRCALALARGRYCFLMGNDDALSGPDVLRDVAAALRPRADLVAALGNYADYRSGELFARVPDGNLGAGPGAAVRLFRHFSFVSGVVLRRAEVHRYGTSDVDGSEMYQMYLACRMLAAGGSCLGISASIVRKDIAIAGETVDSYAQKPRLQPCPIQERRLNLVWIPRLVAAALMPHVSEDQRSGLNRRVLVQLLAYTYPFWLFEYRRIQSWNYAAGIALGMRLRNLLPGVTLTLADRLFVRFVYGAATLGGLLIPRRWFERARRRLFAIAKSNRQPAPREVLAQ